MATAPVLYFLLDMEGQVMPDVICRMVSKIKRVKGPQRPLLLQLGRFSHVQIFETLWSIAHQAPLSMGFSRPEHWSGLPCPPPGGCSQPRDRTCFPSVSCIGRQMPLAPPGKPTKALKEIK